jgi:Na+/H+-dicarboxylate symporter
MEHGTHSAMGPAQGTGFFAAYNRVPLFVRILAALVLGMIVGLKMGAGAGVFKPISDIVLQILRLLATPLIFVAVLNAIYKANATGKAAGRLLALLMTNTVVAILVGLLVANVIQPGRLVHLSPVGASSPRKSVNFFQDLLEKVPANLVDPLQRNEIISIIILAVAFGIAMRIVREQQAKLGKTGCETIGDALDTVFQLVMVMLHWVFALIPLAVFAVVARQVGKDGVKPLAQMLWFVITVVVALGLQAGYYLLRVRFGSWVRPGQFLRGASEALITAFSTASSAATLPITYTCVKDKIGVREESASLGVMVGGTFNHDGTALYEAMAALFVGQMLGYHLGPVQQVSVVIMSVFASVGAAGIPEAGTVTMIAVFTAVKLPTEYIPLLLPLDWFLDRCRTAINVMGDMSVTCILDGKTAPGGRAQQEQPAFVEDVIPVAT